MAPNFIQDFYKGQADFAETFRLLVLKEDEDLFSKLDFIDDNIFLDPFLFLYFRLKILGLTQMQAVNVTLQQILFGYLKKKNILKEYSFTAFSNTYGRVYLPRVGYFDLKVTNIPVEVVFTKDRNEFEFFLNGEKITHIFTPVKFLKHSDIELYQFDEPLFSSLYTKWFQNENGNRIKKNLPAYKLSPSSLYQQNHSKIDFAFQILRNSPLNYCRLLEMSTKGVYSFQQEGLWSFAGKSAHGASFLCGHETDSVIFFFCELAHQGGHSIFDAILYKPEKIFAVSPDSLMAELSGNPADDRTLADALHGLFTTSKVAEVLNYIYTVQHKLKLNNDHKHEILGRLADNHYRHRTGLQNLDHKKVFTVKGFQIYSALDNYLVRVYKKYGDIPVRYKYGQGDFVFNYEAFKLSHPLK